MSSTQIEQEVGKAIAFLVKNVEERPDNISGLFDTLIDYEKNASALNEQIESAKSAIEELSAKFNISVGSIDATAKNIALLLPKDKISEWAEEFNKSQQE